jgi:hypothetical protein
MKDGYLSQLKYQLKDHQLTQRLTNGYHRSGIAIIIFVLVAGKMGLAKDAIRTRSVSAPSIPQRKYSVDPDH